jgi:electron transfer flavoprotein alpha subunit
MTILVIAEHTNAALAAATLNTVAAAQKIGGDIHVLVAGANAGAAAEAAAKIAGVAKVLVADNAAYANQLPENVAPLVAELGKGYSHILAAATSNGKNILPRVAAALDVDQISEIIAVESADTFKRPIYAGNAIATVQSSAAVKVITVRSTGFDAAAAEGGSAAIEAVSGPADAGKSAFVGEELAKSDRPERAGRQAGCCRWCFPRRRRRRLRTERHAGRPDRQDRCSATLRRCRYLRCHPAPGRYEGFQGDRCDQQGRRSADLPGG